MGNEVFFTRTLTNKLTNKAANLPVVTNDARVHYERQLIALVLFCCCLWLTACRD